MVYQMTNISEMGKYDTKLSELISIVMEKKYLNIMMWNVHVVHILLMT